MVDKQSCYCAQWSFNPRLNSMDEQIYLFLGPARRPLPSSHLCLGAATAVVHRKASTAQRR